MLQRLFLARKLFRLLPLREHRGFVVLDFLQRTEVGRYIETAAMLFPDQAEGQGLGGFEQG